MKGGVAGILFAFLTAAEHLEHSMQKGIALALTADEEAGGDLGSKFLVKGSHIEGREAIIAEPTRFRKSGHAVVAGERGNLRTRVIFHGKPAHASMPMLGENAVTKAMTQLNTSSGRKRVLGRVNPPHDARPLISEGRRVLRKESSSGKGRRRDSLENTMNHYTMNLGVISGGTRVNVVPDTCEVQFDLRLPLGGKREDGQRIIQKIAGKEPDIEFFGYSPPSYTPRNSPLVRNLRKVAAKILGKEVPAVCSPYTTDAHHFRDGLNLDAVAFGPGYVDVIHNFNEYVDVNDVLNCCKVYAGYAALYCSAQ
jgi:succinyl-diaminopimelate desuccinylase